MKPVTKNRTVALAAAGILVTSASAVYAGETYIEPVAPPPPPPSLWQWFAGASVGYTNDAEEAFYSGHLGVEKIVGNYSHAFYLEVGYTELDDNWVNDGPPILTGDGDSDPGVLIPTGDNLDIDTEYVPVTLNYKFEFPLFSSFNGYVAAGAGIAFTDTEVSYGGVDIADEDDTAFYGQVGTGLTWNVSECFEVFGGVRWIYLDDYDGGALGDVGDQDDWLGEVGLRWNF